jgi:hypothetical protein
VAWIDSPSTQAYNMGMIDEPTELSTAPASHDDKIGEAYVAGIAAAREGKPAPTVRSPYYRNTEEWVAYRSGWRDETARRQRRGTRKAGPAG